MRFIELLKGMENMIGERTAVAELEIKGLSCDSRTVRPGFVFAALPGARVDGRDYIAAAIENGAVCVLTPAGTKAVAGVLFVEDEEPRRAFAKMAANFYGVQPETVVAITGTNGKTSSVSFLRQIWQHLGHKAAGLGTLGVHGAGFDEAGVLTTSEPVKLHETLKRLADAGVDHLAMEASSIGLEQFRLDGVRIKAAGFTNISRDHLDYHGDMQSYLRAKLRLFAEVVEDGGTAVVNADRPEAQEIVATARKRGLEVLTYGRAGQHIRLLEREAQDDAQRLLLQVEGQKTELFLPLVGAFQVENALCALGLALAVGADRQGALEALERLQGAPGRMQRIGALNNGARVYVDYAHTPDALDNVLSALRAHTGNKLYVLFGCGGERDVGKRAEMGRVASRRADGVIVTDDNPRGEDAAAIRAQIVAATRGGEEIADRGEAIFSAIEKLRAGDVLVLAGKGHEQSQIIGDRVIAFDDAAQAVAAIAELGR